jgi:predicted lactoylglutathione lyase
LSDALTGWQDLGMKIQPVFDQVNLVVRDMSASVEFYRRLGLDIPDTDPTWQGHHRNATTPEGIDLDLDSISFATKWNAGSNPDAPAVVIGFRVPSREAVDELYTELTEAGHAGQQPPYDASWGARYAVISDPDGNGVGIMSSVEPALRWTISP